MRSAFEKPCTGTSRRSRRETGSFTFRLARHECYCQRVPSAAGRASRTSVGSERRLRVGSASSWAPDAVVRPRTCADRRSACANDRCRHHQLSPRRERRSRSKVDLSLAEKTAAGCNGSISDSREGRRRQTAANFYMILATRLLYSKQVPSELIVRWRT